MAQKQCPTTWHHRLGHPSPKIMQMLSLVSPTYFRHPNSCNACQVNKSDKLPFSDSSITSTAPLDLIFSDIWTSPVLSYDKFKYYIIFVDHFTQYIWLYPIHNKSDSLNIFLRFEKLVEKHLIDQSKRFIVIMVVNTSN